MSSAAFIEAFPDIIELARLAPSVHNTQPWIISQVDSSIEVRLDKNHVLKDGDPTGRQTIISLGILAEAIMLAAANYGFKGQNIRLDDETLYIDFQSSKDASADTKRNVDLLKSRCSDRSIYKSATLSDKQVQNIEQLDIPSGVKVHVIRDKDHIEKIAGYTAKGIGLALSNPNFRKELSGYLVTPWSSKKRGISVKSLYINPLLAACQPLFMRLGIGISREVSLERKRWLSASAIIIITADGDLSKFWFESGRAYLRVSLAIEGLGLSQATSAAIVEASNYHDDVEELLGTNQRIISVIRVGQGATSRKHSPRLEVADLTTLN
jgi:hypothetical protein